MYLFHRLCSPVTRVLRSILPVSALITAAVVCGMQGQPAVPQFPTGRSVAVEHVSMPSDLGTLLMVLDGELIRLDVSSATQQVIRLPPGERPLRALSLQDADVVLTVNESLEPSAFALSRNEGVTRLGEATDIVRDLRADRIWLVNDTASQLATLSGKFVGEPVHTPAGYSLVGVNERGLVLTSADQAPATVLLGPHGVLQPVSNAIALDVLGDLVLVKQFNRAGVLNLELGNVAWGAPLSAVRFRASGSFSPDGTLFAAVGRIGLRNRLIVGPVTATRADQLQVVEFGEASSDDRTIPIWVGSNTVAAVRNQGGVVIHTWGNRRAWLFGADYPAIGVAAPTP